MRAARIHRYGPPDVLQVDEVPEPRPGPRDVRVEVHAASVNPVDWKIRAGHQRALIHYQLPWILGLDVSGRVIEVGSEVTRFRVGDEVYGSPTHRRPGTYAEQIVVDERAVALKPRGISHVEAASIPLVGLTAWDALVVGGRLRTGQRALIHAGSGGVGTFAIQLAKDLGATVATTCSERNAELVRSLGADRVIDYRAERFERAVNDLDFVLDALGGEERDRSLTIVKRGGCVATMVGGFPEHVERFGVALGTMTAVGSIAAVTLRGAMRGVRVYFVLRESDGAMLEQITRRIERGAIRPVIDRVFPLEEIAEAHHYSETARARGKIAIAIREGAG